MEILLEAQSFLQCFGSVLDKERERERKPGDCKDQRLEKGEERREENLNELNSFCLSATINCQ